jgi:hypothetical protein
MRAINIIYAVPFFAGLLLQIFAIDLFRLTFVSTIIPVGLYVLSGLIGFVILRKKLMGPRRLNLPGIFVVLIWCIVSIGGTLSFLFLATNFYLANGHTTRQAFSIEKTGKYSSRYSSCVESYAVINKDDLKKEINFTCDQLNKMGGNKTKIDLTISKGVFGFDIIRDKQLIQ